MVLFDGATVTGKDNEITNFSFSKSDFPLNNFKTNTTTYIKTQEQPSLDLLKCIKILNNNINVVSQDIKNCSQANLINIYKELYKRFIIPFYIPLLMLIPFLLIISSKENANYQKIKTMTFSIGLFFIIFSETTIRLISTIHLKNIIGRQMLF